MTTSYWSQIPKGKLIVYGILTIIIFVAQQTVAQALILLTGLYMGWRVVKLVSHSLHCPSCQIKLAGAVLLFLGAIFMAGPYMLMLLVFVLWADALLIDKNDRNTARAYYG